MWSFFLHSINFSVSFSFPQCNCCDKRIAFMHVSLFILIVSLTLFVHKIVWFVLFDSSHKSRTKFHLIPILIHANTNVRIFNGTVTKATNSTEFLIDRAIYSADFILFCKKVSFDKNCCGGCLQVKPQTF